MQMRHSYSLHQTFSHKIVTRKVLSKTLSLVISMSLIFGSTPYSMMSHAQVVADPNASAQHRPDITNPPNSHNVPVVNIATPNGAGISHNQYQQFNVDQQGLILNNGVTNSNTHLGGWIQGNPNLAGRQARIILNEVTSGNPSMLRGYIEVGGGRAEVIIANPAGISVNGGGFINASGVTLTTGTPQFNYTGNLEAFRVAGGNITINGEPGKGLDTSGADYTRIISRAAEINSGIWANDLTLTAGVGVIAPNGDPIQLTIEDEQGKPLYAIDVAQLGGMYAGKIRLIGTEAGVGVRNAGHIGAQAGQVVVTASGQLINSGTINSNNTNNNNTNTAPGNIQLSATEITNSGTVYAQSGLQVTASGQLTNTGTLAAQGNTTIAAQNIHNQNGTNSAVIAGGMSTDGKLTGQGGVSLNASQSVNNQGTILGQNHANITTQTLTNTGTIQATQDASLQAQKLNNTGTLYAQGNLNATVTQNLTNSGTIVAQNNTTVNAQKITNQSTGLIGAGMDAQGQFTSAGNVRLTATQNIENTGNIYSGKDLHLTAQNIINQNAIHAGQNATLQAQTMSNQSGSLGAANDILLQADSLNNQGGAIVAKNITLDGSNNTGSGAGSGTNNGIILNNTSGVIASTQNISAQAQSLNNAAGQLNAGGDINLTFTGEYTNVANSQIIANNNLNLQVTENSSGTSLLTNQGKLLAGEQANISAKNISNAATGEIAGSKTNITASQNLTNRGLIDGAVTLLKAQNITNLGAGRIYGDHVAIEAQTLTNQDEGGVASVIAARNWMDLGVGTLHNKNNAMIYSAGEMRIGGSLDADNHVTGSATLVQNDGATIESGGNMVITANQVNNTNPIFAVEDFLLSSDTKFLHILPDGREIDNRNVFYFKEKNSLDFTIDRFFQVGSLADAHAALGESSHYFLVTPKNFTAEQYRQIASLGGVPDPSIDILGQVRTDIYPHDHAVWQVFGLQAPAPVPTDGLGNPCDGVTYCTSGNELIQFNSWHTTAKARYQSLNDQIDEFNVDFHGGKISMETMREYIEASYRTQITHSNPGQILSGGSLIINGNVTNDKSRIMAGGDLHMNGSVNTIDAQGQNYTLRDGVEINTIRTASGRDWSPTGTFNQREQHATFSLNVAALEQNTTVTGSGTQVGNLNTGNVTVTPIDNNTQVSTVNPNPSIPNSSLYTFNPGTDKNYLIETDPRFANYGKWLTSDHMLSALGLDPNIAKRMGDGYYEQQLIREQIGKLTGYRFLAGYNSDDEQYKALMNAGVEFAQEHQLSVGIALTPAQMKQLTSDIVWLVSTDVTLPNGSVETVLVLQVYTRSGANMITTGGTLMSGNNVIIQGKNPDGSVKEITLNNTATIAAREGLFVDVSHLQNTLGQLHGNNVVLNSATDINNLGGIISADNSLTMVAGRDINIASTVAAGSDTRGHITNIGNTGVVYLSGQGQANAQATNNGQIQMQAGRDVNLNAAYISNDATPQMLEPPVIQTRQTDQPEQPDSTTQQESAASDPAQQATHWLTTPSTTIAAGAGGSGSINLGTVTTSQSHNANFDTRNWRRESSSTEVGTTITTQSDINLIATDHVGIRAGNLESQQGNLNVAANTITLEAGENDSSTGTGFYGSFKGMVSSKSYERRYLNQQTSLAGSSLSAEAINLQAGQNINIQASDVVATKNLNLVSQSGDINITAGTGQTTNESYERTKRSGFMSSGGIGFTLGKKQATTDQISTQTTAHGSTVGSLEGNVNISAQQGTYNQVGSDVLSLDGNINVVAQDINIVEARELYSNLETQEYKQTGLTLSIGGSLGGLIQTVQQMDDASKKTSSSRADALAAGAVALKIVNNWDSIRSLAEVGQAGAVNSGAVGISATLGTSKSKSTNFQDEDAAKGSGLTAGGSINLMATGTKDGDGNVTGGNILIQGSDVNAGKNLTLIANDQVNILAAVNTASGLSNSKSSSGSIGVTYAGSWSISVGMSKGKGKGNSADTTWSGSHLNAGETLTIISGGDTNIIGSQVGGHRVQADIGGDLNIQSLQDTSYAHSSQKNSSASLTVGFNAGSIANGGGSFSSSKASATGQYASVNEYAGIMAGDGGFNIIVQGNTDLKGAIIASSQNAVDNDRNQLTTGSLTISDIANISTSQSKGSTSGMGLSFTSGGGMPGFSPPTALKGKDSSHDASVTLSGISGGKITITNEAEQLRLTGQTADEAIAGINTAVLTGQSANGLNKDWNTDKMVEEMQANLEIADAFNRELGTFAATKSRELDKAREALKNETDPQKHAELEAYIAQNQMWDVGGVGRLGITAIAAALSGNVSGSSADLLRDTTVNVLQGLAATQIKHFVDNHFEGDDTLRAALHAINACAGASAQSADCGSAALGAAGNVVINRLIYGSSDPNLTQEQKNARINLLTTIIAAVSDASGGDSAIASAAARIEAENNQEGMAQMLPAMGWSPHIMAPVASAEAEVAKACYLKGGCTTREEYNVERNKVGLPSITNTDPSSWGSAVNFGREAILPITFEDGKTLLDPEASFSNKVIIGGAIALGPLGDLIGAARKIPVEEAVSLLNRLSVDDAVAAANKITHRGDAVTVTGTRAIDKAQSFERGISASYGGVRPSHSDRTFTLTMDGNKVTGVADDIRTINGKKTAIDAKFVENWDKSPRNPASSIGNMGFAVEEQKQMVRQARQYAAAFPGGAVYHTNSRELAEHYSRIFVQEGITNFRFVITPVK